MTQDRDETTSALNKPSVKGTALLSVVEDYQRLLAVGVISEEDQAKYLTPEDLEILGGVVTPVGWYAVETFSRAMDLLARKEAGTDREGYFVQRGYRAAERLIGGTYHRFDTEPGSWGPRVGETLMGLGRIVYNFATWHFHELEPGVYEVEVREAGEFPDAALFTAQGFLNFFASHASGRPIEASSQRLEDGRIVYRFHDRP